MKFVPFAMNVLGIPLTDAQRVLCLVAFDDVEPCSLPESDRAIASELFGPVDEVPSSARSVLVAVVGARSGKTYLLVAAYSLWRAIFADLSTLAPGEVACALIVCPDIRLGKQALRYVAGAVNHSADLVPMIESDTADSLTLRRFDGRLVVIEVLPATRGGSALRGRSLVCACLDESAFFRDENAVVNDQDLFRAVAPRVLPGGLVVIASTPWMEQGLLHAFYESDWGAPKVALVAQAPTLLMLPTTRNREAVERAMETDPENAEREFGAKFLLGGASVFFSADVLKDTITDEFGAGSPIPLSRSFVGGDIGLVRDSSAFVACARVGDLIVVTDMVELRPTKSQPLKLSFVVQHAAEFSRRYQAGDIAVDHHVLQPAREHLPRGLILRPVPGGQAAKVDRFIAVRQAMKEGRVLIPDALKRLRMQLGEVHSKSLSGGGVQIIQRRRQGAHGDIASAFILAAWRALMWRPPLLGGGIGKKEKRPRDDWTTESARDFEILKGQIMTLLQVEQMNHELSKELNQSKRARLEQDEKLRKATSELAEVTAERDHFKKQLATANEQLKDARAKVDSGVIVRTEIRLRSEEALATGNAVISLANGQRHETRKGDILVTTMEAKQAADARGGAIVSLVTEATIDELVGLNLAMRAMTTEY